MKNYHYVILLVLAGCGDRPVSYTKDCIEAGAHCQITGGGLPQATTVVTTATSTTTETTVKTVVGQTGQAGSSPVFSTVAATSEQCPDGGSVITITSTDASVKPQTTIVCNGTAGQSTVGATGATGPVGPTGNTGSVGPSGVSVVYATTPATTEQCANGGTVIIMADDTNGDGVPDAGDANMQSTVLCNGTDGTNGTSPTYTPVIVIQPCGANSSAYKEALLGLQGGAIFSEFTGNGSDANSVRNTLLPDGSYEDTDNSYCNFTVSTDAHGDRTVEWSGASGSGNTYPAGSVVYNATTQTWSQE